MKQAKPASGQARQRGGARPKTKIDNEYKVSIITKKTNHKNKKRIITKMPEANARSNWITNRSKLIDAQTYLLQKGHLGLYVWRL